METKREFPLLTRNDLPSLYALCDAIRSAWRYVPLVDQAESFALRGSIGKLQNHLNQAANNAAFIAGVVEAMKVEMHGEEEEF